ncbi:MAG TPA: MOSC domain-containing protein [Coleofasciculaceae cyanobacterium]|jgi:MOSC domain-containing protein YiiM
MGKVIAVSINSSHSFSKSNREKIKLLAGLGVEGDAHCGKTVKHRSRLAKNPKQPNLRQVHLIHAELHEELNNAGFNILPGQMGENITTMGIDLLGLPTDTLLHIKEAVIQITGLRNPCAQLDNFKPGLMAAVLDRDKEGKIIRKAGIMGIVLASGVISAGNIIQTEFPSLPHRPLEKV